MMKSYPIVVSPNVSAVGSPKEGVMIQGLNGKIWVSGYQLVGIAKHYAKEQKLEFDFEGTETNVWVNPGRRIRVDVDFSSGMGKPILDVAIDKHGKAVSHSIGTAICGTGM